MSGSNAADGSTDNHAVKQLLETLPSEGVKVYCGTGTARKHALWTTAAEMLAGQRARWPFLLTDAHYKPLEPPQQITAVDLQRQANYAAPTDWRVRVRLGVGYAGLAAGTLAKELFRLVKHPVAERPARAGGESSAASSESQSEIEGQDDCSDSQYEDDSEGQHKGSTTETEVDDDSDDDDGDDDADDDSPDEEEETEEQEGGSEGDGRQGEAEEGIQDLPAEGLRVYCGDGDSRRHALWITAAATLAGRQSGEGFLLTDADYQPLEPRQRVKARQFMQLAGHGPVSQWKNKVHLADTYAGCAQHTSVKVLCTRLKPKQGNAIQPVKLQDLPAEGLRVYCGDGDLRQYALWTSVAEVLAGRLKGEGFLLTDADYKPLEPPRRVTARQLAQQALCLHLSFWKQKIKFSRMYRLNAEAGGRIKLASGSTIDKMCLRLQAMARTALQLAKMSRTARGASELGDEELPGGERPDHSLMLDELPPEGLRVYCGDGDLRQYALWTSVAEHMSGQQVGADFLLTDADYKPLDPPQRVTGSYLMKEAKYSNGGWASRIKLGASFAGFAAGTTTFTFFKHRPRAMLRPFKRGKPAQAETEDEDSEGEQEENRRPFDVPAEGIRVYCRLDSHRQHALWTTLRQYVAGKGTGAGFLLTDADFKPLEPRQEVIAKRLVLMTGFANGMHWIDRVKVAMAYAGIRPGVSVSTFLRYLPPLVPIDDKPVKFQVPAEGIKVFLEKDGKTQHAMWTTAERMLAGERAGDGFLLTDADYKPLEPRQQVAPYIFMSRVGYVPGQKVEWKQKVRLDGSYAGLAPRLNVALFLKYVKASYQGGTSKPSKAPKAAAKRKGDESQDEEEAEEREDDTAVAPADRPAFEVPDEGLRLVISKDGVTRHVLWLTAPQYLAGRSAGDGFVLTDADFKPLEPHQQLNANQLLKLAGFHKQVWTFRLKLASDYADVAAGSSLGTLLKHVGRKPADNSNPDLEQFKVPAGGLPVYCCKDSKTQHALWVRMAEYMAGEPNRDGFLLTDADYKPLEPRQRVSAPDLGRLVGHTGIGDWKTKVKLGRATAGTAAGTSMTTLLKGLKRLKSSATEGASESGDEGPEEQEQPQPLKFQIPAEGLKIYCAGHKGTQHALWFRAADYLSGQPPGNDFLLTDADYKPLVPRQVVRASVVLQRAASTSNEWRSVIKLGDHYGPVAAGRTLRTLESRVGFKPAGRRKSKQRPPAAALADADPDSAANSDEPEDEEQQHEEQEEGLAQGSQVQIPPEGFKVMCSRDGVAKYALWTSAAQYLTGKKPGEGFLLTDANYEPLEPRQMTNANAMLRDAGFPAGSSWRACLRIGVSYDFIAAGRVLQTLLNRLGCQRPHLRQPKFKLGRQVQVPSRSNSTEQASLPADGSSEEETVTDTDDDTTDEPDDMQMETEDEQEEESEVEQEEESEVELVESEVELVELRDKQQQKDVQMCDVDDVDRHAKAANGAMQGPAVRPEPVPMPAAPTVLTIELSTDDDEDTNQGRMHVHMPKAALPAEGWRVYCGDGDSRKYALLTSVADVLAGARGPVDLLLTDADYKPLEPRQPVNASQFVRAAGLTDVSNWRQIVRMGMSFSGVSVGAAVQTAVKRLQCGPGQVHGSGKHARSRSRDVLETEDEGDDMREGEEEANRQERQDVKRQKLWTATHTTQPSTSSQGPSDGFDLSLLPPLPPLKYKTSTELILQSEIELMSGLAGLLHVLGHGDAWRQLWHRYLHHYITSSLTMRHLDEHYEALQAAVQSESVPAIKAVLRDQFKLDV